MPPRPPSLAGAPTVSGAGGINQDNEAAACHAPREHRVVGAGAKSARRFGGAEPGVARRRRRRKPGAGARRGRTQLQSSAAAAQAPWQPRLATRTLGRNLKAAVSPFPGRLEKVVIRKKAQDPAKRSSQSSAQGRTRLAEGRRPWLSGMKRLGLEGCSQDFSSCCLRSSREVRHLLLGCFGVSPTAL